MVYHYFVAVGEQGRCEHRHKLLSTAQKCGGDVHFIVTDEDGNELADVEFDDDASWRDLLENEAIDEDDAEDCIMILAMLRRRMRADYN